MNLFLQIFAHATTAQLSWHVQNFIVITKLGTNLHLDEISTEFELLTKVSLSRKDQRK